MSQVSHVLPNPTAKRYRITNVVRSEVVKIMTLRSTAAMLGLTVVGSLLVTWLVVRSNLHHPAGWYFNFDATQNSLIDMIVAGLTGGVFGALLMTGEYASGTIRTTLTATPRRPILLAAKIGVTAITTVVFCEVLSFVSFWLGQALLSNGGAPHVSLGFPGAFRAVTMTGLFVALLALMSFGFGLIFRSTAAAIAAFVAVVFVLPLVMHGINETDLKFMPTNILANSITATIPQGPNAVSPGIGLLLMFIYAAIPLAAGVVLFLKRDA